MAADPLPLFVDSDNALGSRRGDVDDAFALAALLSSDEQVLGLASVAGNAPEPEAFRNNRTLAELCGYAGPCLRGSEVPALEIWTAAEPCRWLALGPLTHVAASLAAARRNGRSLPVAEVVLVGANASSRGRFPPIWPHEFNLTKDRAATEAVFASELPLTLVPLDVARRLRLGPERLRQIEGPLGEHLRRHSRRWLRRSFWLHGPGGFPCFDLVAAMAVLAPKLVEVRETTVRMHPNLWIEFGAGERSVRWVADFDEEPIWEYFLDLVVERQRIAATQGRV
jgi:inosine-uridine nucleoside N-ribohydrolase